MMQVQGNDILLMIDELIDCGISRRTSFRLSTGGIIYYSALKPAYQSLIRSKLCGGLEPSEYLAQKASEESEAQFSRLVGSLSDKLEVWSSDIEHLTGKGYDIAAATRIARAAGWCRLFRSPSQIPGLSRPAWQAKVFEAMQAEQLKGWVKFPKAINSVSSLEQAARRLAGNGIPAFENRYKNIANAAKVKDEKQVNLLIRLGSDYRNLDCQQIADLYNEIAGKAGWDKITAGTVRNWREKYNLETLAGRRGTTVLRNTLEQTARRIRPTASMLMWSADGWDVELFYRAHKETKSGGSVITYNNRLTVVAVIDPYNDYPVGYAIGTHETPELIREALRNAANHTAELFGRRQMVYQFQSDRYAISKMTPTYENISKYVTPAQVRNAKAKPVEPYFKYLNKKYCQYKQNWSGFGLKSRRESQPNDEVLNLVKKDFPDMEGCRTQIVQIMETERLKKRENYLQGWEKTDRQFRLSLDTEQYLITFGIRREERNTLCASGLLATIGGIRMQYENDTVEFRRNSHIRWQLCYDPADLREVLAIDESGDKRFLMYEKPAEYMCIADQKKYGNPDEHVRARRNANNRNMESHIAKTMGDAYNSVSELFDEIPELRAVQDLHKLIITDSNGQHKDNRNAVRGAKKTQQYALPKAAGAEELEWYELI